MYVCVYVCVSACVCACMYAYIHKCVSIYVCMHACLHENTKKVIADLLPQAAGCSGQRNAGRQSFTVYYPGVVPARRSRTWGDVCSEEACKFSCVQWAWNHHTRLTGEACPHDLRFGA